MVQYRFSITPKRFLLTLFCTFSLLLNAQKSHVYNFEDKNFKKGLELFNKEKFGAAQESFRLVIEQYKNENSLVKPEAEYYYAVCAVELFNPDAEFLVKSFIEKYPESTRLQYAYLYLGKYKYREEKFPEALSNFEKIDVQNLAKEDRTEFLFKKGYCLFQAQNNDKASECFKIIKEDSSNKYHIPALYYYSHIEYQNKHYETALKGFTSLKSDETFAPVVPYYITQILFIQKKYQEVIDYATPLMESASVNRVSEIARMLGESYFQLNLYELSLTCMEKYFQTAKNISSGDNYLMGFLYYKTTKYSSAINYLSKVTNNNDSMAQNAYYHLADCYIKTNQKEKARNAFSAAAKLDADKAIKQDAMFSLAKINFDLSRSPFNETITSFQDYINAYPDASNIDEAYSYLVKVYMTTKSYKDALIWLDKIKKRDNEMNLAYQRIAFYRGMEVFNSLDFTGAIEYFNKSLQYDIFDKNITALSYFWRGDAQFRLENYDKAIDDYKTFVLSPGALGKTEYNLVHYYLGYCFFKQKKYDESSTWFRKYLDLKNVNKDKYYCDASNRTADGYFMQKKYDLAQKFYDMAFKVNSFDFDYALFQKAFCLGLLKKYDDKIAAMTQLITLYPSSSYVDDANFEIAETWCAKEQQDKAIPYYETVISKFPGCSYVKKSMLQLGLIYYNLDQTDKALTTYKQFVNDYKGTPESKNALTGIKNIYIGKSDVNGYIEYMKSVNGNDAVSQFAQDSLVYLAGEDAYMKENCTKSNELFSSYLKSFPNGLFSINALFFRADCFMKAQQIDSAYNCYEQIAQKPKNKYTEASLFNLSLIKFNKADYKKSLEYYTSLEAVAEYQSNIIEARKGQLLCNDKLKDSVATINSARKLLSTEKLPDELKRLANYEIAGVYNQQNKLDSALELYITLSQDVKSVEGAESKFRVAEILFKKGNYDESEKEILDFLDKNSPQQYWLARSYMLWAEIFVVRKDFFQGKHTLQSIIDNYPNKTDGILEMAQQKLDKFNAMDAPAPIEQDKADEVQMK